MRLYSLGANKNNTHREQTMKTLFMAAKKPDWNDAPEWANWLGVSKTKSGEWTWYQDNPLPSPHLNYLWGGGKSESTGIVFKTDDIQSTIESRQ